MKQNFLSLLFGLGIIGVLLGLRYFPNAWFLVISAMLWVATFCLWKAFKNDDNLANHVEKAHILRLVFIFFPILALGILLTGLTLWGIYLQVFETDFWGTTYLSDSRTSGKRMPEGTYWNAVLLVGVSSFFMLFGTMTLFGVRSTVRGLTKRFRSFDSSKP